MSAAQKLKSKVYSLGRGSAFSSKDFAQFGSRSAVDVALYRLLQEGFIRRVLRGIYDYPRISKLLKEPLGPDLDQVARALARKFGWTIQPSGATALNYLRLSTQLQGRYVYQSDGPNRVYEIGTTTLEFAHTPLKETGFKHPESAIIVGALKALGEGRIDEEVISTIRVWLEPSKRKAVLKDTLSVTSWVYALIRRICAEDG